MNALAHRSTWKLILDFTPMTLLAALALGVGGIVAWASASPAWASAVGVALSLFFSLKLATLHGVASKAPASRVLGYLLLWPGMNAPTFLDVDRAPPPRPDVAELLAALTKMGLGLALTAWAAMHTTATSERWIAWGGVLGIIFVFHFGVFHVFSWAWRRAGVTAPPLMRAPIAARSLADFWGERWNTAFNELARRFVLRPYARRLGVGTTSALVFLVSGIVHEIAISLPARGGWGGPTLYFLLQGAGLALEKTRTGRRLGLGARGRGWLWTLLFTAAPLPLLFHGPLIERVVVPLLETLKEAL